MALILITKAAAATLSETAAHSENLHIIYHAQKVGVVGDVGGITARRFPSREACCGTGARTDLHKMATGQDEY